MEMENILIKKIILNILENLEEIYLRARAKLFLKMERYLKDILIIFKKGKEP